MDSHEIVKFFHTLSLQIMQKDSYLLCVFLIFLKIIKALFILHDCFKQGEKNELNKKISVTLLVTGLSNLLMLLSSLPVTLPNLTKVLKIS